MNSLDQSATPNRRSPASGCSALLPCPFCGGDAESDTMQAYRRMTNGTMGNSVAIYCTKCSVQMTMCDDDFPQYEPEDRLYILTESWNVRVPNAEVSDTPRTDDAQWGTGKVTTDFARTLEREIKSLKEELERAKNYRNKAGVIERQKYLPEIRRLRGEVEKAYREGAKFSHYGLQAYDYSRARRVAEGKE